MTLTLDAATSHYALALWRLVVAHDAPWTHRWPHTPLQSLARSNRFG